MSDYLKEEYLELEDESWEGVTVYTNSSHKKGISFLHGDIAVKFKNVEGI